jgi:DNA (cytosine-5)-methyltransferase 1
VPDFLLPVDRSQLGFEIENSCCNTLHANRPHWHVIEGDVKDFDGRPYHGTDLLAGGVPCPPFSKAGKQLGSKDERDLFPVALRLVDEIRPSAVMLENVRGFLDPIFEEYRLGLKRRFEQMGYAVGWRLLNASDYGVSQLRPRVVIVALRNNLSEVMSWPPPARTPPMTVGELLQDQMALNGWIGAAHWARQADNIAPTVVGGSKKHGGADLGPTRAKKAWAALGVDGKRVADAPPERNFVGMPRLTTRMVARIQGFSDEWLFIGKKTPVYRQIGNAFPPPVAYAVASEIHRSLTKRKMFALAA